MLELRWKKLKITERPPEYSVPVHEQMGIVSYQVLQFRYLKFRMDASGAVNIMPPEWTEWEDVDFGHTGQFETE